MREFVVFPNNIGTKGYPQRPFNKQAPTIKIELARNSRWIYENRYLVLQFIPLERIIDRAISVTKGEISQSVIL